MSRAEYISHFRDSSYSFISTVGEAGIMLAIAIKRILSGRIDWGETLDHIDRSGIGSLPIVAVSASFIGMALSVQFAREIVVRYGADFLVGGFVAISMFRELAPIFVAVVMAGNIGASTTAEIGAMKVTDQIDALKVFRINPLEYLVIPRIVAMLIVGPALTIFGVFLALLTGQLFSELLVGVPGRIFWDSVQFTTQISDITSMLVKSLVFAVTIAIISTSNGMATEGSSEAVGISTTRTVVWCLLAIFILNYGLTTIFFEL